MVCLFFLFSGLYQGSYKQCYVCSCYLSFLLLERMLEFVENEKLKDCIHLSSSLWVTCSSGG